MRDGRMVVAGNTSGPGGKGDATVKLITKTLTSTAATEATGRADAPRRSILALIERVSRTRPIQPTGHRSWS